MPNSPVGCERPSTASDSWRKRLVDLTKYRDNVQMSAVPNSPTVVSLYDAKTHLSELGERAAAGEEIVVTKHGRPKFRIVAVAPRRPRPLPGSIDIGLTGAERASLDTHDWFAPDEEIDRLFGTRE